MRKLFNTVLLLGMIASCSQKEKGEDEPAQGDLKYLNSSVELGVGKESSLKTGAFIDCTSSASAYIPKFLSKMIVAFGGSARGGQCNFCTISYDCSPGETVNIKFTSTMGGAYSTPADYEADLVNATNIDTEDQTCPSNGNLTTTTTAAGSFPYIKVEVSGVLGIDTEYLKCF